MQKDLILKIDALIEMSKSSSNIDTLKAELTEINEEIETKKRDLEEQRTSIKDEKYIKASDRIIDENIKVSLELKIRKLLSSLKELEKELKVAIKKEDETHTKLEKLQDKIAKLNSLIETLKEKLSTVSNNDIEIREYYQSLIAEQEKKRNKKDVELKMTEEEYRLATEHLMDLTSKVEEQKNRLNTEQEKLRDTEANLASNNSYMDTELKKEDEQRLHSLEEKLDALEARKEEIQTDPVMIGNEAKELLLEDDRTGCFLKVKELVNLLKKTPYMDIATSSELENVLANEEEQAIQERDEFASLLENKKYDSNDAPIILEREKYLEQQKSDLESELNALEMKIKKIDTIKIREISSLLSSANIISENLRKELAEYKKVMESNAENATPRKKAILNAAYAKKEEELNSIGQVIESYEAEMQDLMRESKQIAEEEITNLNNKIAKIDEYLKEINKKTMISSKAKDVLAVENDKAKLKELTDKVKEISALKKLKQTPSEIYHEIETMLGSFIANDLNSEPIDKEEPKAIIEEQQPDLVNNFRIMDESDKIPTFNRSEKNKDVLNDEDVEKMKKSMDVNFDIPWQEPQVEKETMVEPSIPTETIEPKVEDPIALDIEPFGPAMNMDPFEKVNIEEIENPSNMEEPTVSPLNPFIEEVSPITEETPQPLEELSPLPEVEPINMDELIPFDTPVKERFKVIDVEPLEEETPQTQEPVVQDDVMITDFKDEDYIDFNTLLDGGNV